MLFYHIYHTCTVHAVPILRTVYCKVHTYPGKYYGCRLGLPRLLGILNPLWKDQATRKAEGRDRMSPAEATYTYPVRSTSSGVLVGH